MTLSQSIVKHGTQAVRVYQKMAASKNDNEVPEVFLGSWIARGLFDELGINAHVERSYTKMTQELGFASDKFSSSIDLWRADIALYKDGKPSGIIEIKIYDETGKDALIRRDLDKMRVVSRDLQLDVYLGVLITDTASKTCDMRAQALCSILQGKFDEPYLMQQANDGLSNWSWCFACGMFN